MAPFYFLQHQEPHLKTIPPILPDRSYLRELCRPWKLLSFSAAMVWLVYGALAYRISDWDVGVCFVMGSSTYLCAPWSVELIRRARHREPGWPLQAAASLLLAILNVDTLYWAYHSLAGNQMLRWENFKVSLPLYYICGLGWYYRGSLADLAENLRDLSGSRRSRG